MEGLPDLQISDHCLIYFYEGNLLVFDVRRSAWRRISLEFCPLEGRKFSNFMASDGGLICLITECGEYFVCNPFTKCYKKLPKPPQDPVEDSLLNILQYPGSHLGTRDFAVEIVVQSNSDFKLVVAIREDVVRTFVYDSLDNDWREVIDSRKGLYLYFTWPRASCRGSLYLTGLSSSNTRVVLKYNPEEARWKAAKISHYFFLTPITILAKDGTVLLGCVAIDNQVTFFEIQDLGLELRLVPSRLELPFLPSRDPLVQCPISEEYTGEFGTLIGGEDVVYNVRIRRSEKRNRNKEGGKNLPNEQKPPARKLHERETFVLVWMHNIVDGSNRVSLWHEIGQQPDVFPWENLHFFKPTKIDPRSSGSASSY